ncbi:hypothetical protein IWX78_002353 [Mycetocola sp. CAN_C7]|uniref:hypothetical protein n=1 Tax=Mycetocola sp. CAN_C7 TaxID=2787724 RepID=UPI0018CB81AB
MTASTGKRLLANVVDPRRIEYGVASSVVVGALSLVDPAKLSLGGRLAFRGFTAAVTGGLVLLELRRSDALRDNPIARAGIIAALVGTTFGLGELSERIDARIVGVLRRAGVRRPRLSIAVASAALSLAAYRIDPAQTEADHDGSDGDWPRFTPVDPAVRALVDGMLSATDGHGAAELRAHWPSARVEHWSDDDERVFSRWLEFSVDESLPRAVPHDATFPVRARFLSSAGVPVEAFLLVSGGRPRSLLLDVVPDTPELDGFGGDDPLDDVDSWPPIDAVAFILDTA